MTWLLVIALLGFMFGALACCCCTRCLECDAAEIEALGINVTVAGLADDGCTECDLLNGTYFLPWVGYLYGGQGCEFKREFPDGFVKTFCGEEVEFGFRVVVRCGESIDVAMYWNNQIFFASSAVTGITPKMGCDFGPVSMTSISWVIILCDTSSATITISAA